MATAADDSGASRTASTRPATGTASKAPKGETASATPSAADRDRDATTGKSTGGTSEAQQEEYAATGQNPALDNRTGDQRPGAKAFAPKPQQYPGPEVGHIRQHAAGPVGEAFREQFGTEDDEPGPAHAGGPHGRGDRFGPSSAGADGEPGSDADPVSHES